MRIFDVLSDLLTVWCNLEEKCAKIGAITRQEMGNLPHIHVLGLFMEYMNGMWISICQ